MRKHLSGIHLCIFAECFHLVCDVTPIQVFSASCYKDTPRRNASFLRVPFQFRTQLFGKQNLSGLSLQCDHSSSVCNPFHGDRRKFADSNSCRCQGLQQQRKLHISPVFRCAYQPFILRPMEFPLRIAKRAGLDPNPFDDAVIPLQIPEQTIERCQLRVHSTVRILRHNLLLIRLYQVRGNISFPGKCTKGTDISQILLDGSITFSSICSIS